MKEVKKVSEEELQNYSKHFDSNVAHFLLKKLRKLTRDKPKIVAGATGAIVTVLGNLLSAWENPATPAPLKALAIGAIGYIILPVDLIPDVLPAVGYTDDLASAGGLVAAVSKYCTFKLADLDKEIDNEEGKIVEYDISDSENKEELDEDLDEDFDDILDEDKNFDNV